MENLRKITIISVHSNIICKLQLSFAKLLNLDHWSVWSRRLVSVTVAYPLYYLFNFNVQVADAEMTVQNTCLPSSQ